MADITIFSDKISDDSTLLAALQEGMFDIARKFNMNGTHSYENYTANSRMYDFWKLSQDTLRGPLPVELKVYSRETVDIYTLETEKQIVMSDIIIGTEGIAIPKFTRSLNLLTDILVSAMFYAIKDMPSMTYSLMQVAFFFVSKYSHNKIEESEYNRINLKAGDIL